MHLDPTERFVPSTSPAELLSLAVGGGDQAIDDTDVDLGAFLCACPELELYGALGRGGMGVVYRARQVRLERDVAVKLMKPELAADPEFAERFEREAKALARLDHPGIVRVHDFGLAAGVYYLVMELVDGPNLRQLIDLGIEQEQAIEVISQLCDALAYAHDEGIVHRDIKPENVLIDRRGRVKVADFGLAKLAQDDHDVARTRRVMGTLHYMAPEQMRDPAGVDARCDIFSIGVVSYEMLTGQLPVGRFPPPSELGGGNSALDEIVLRALESDRDRRYGAASELQAALSSIAEPTAVDHPSAPATTRWRWAAGAAALAGGVAVWAAVQTTSPASSEPTDAVAEDVTAEPQTEPPPADAPSTTPSIAAPTTTPTPNLNRWPAKELASLHPETIAVIGLDWGEVRQAPLINQLTRTAFQDVPEELTPCAELFTEHAYKGLVAFSEEGFQELVVHGRWSDRHVQPCIEALGPAIHPFPSDGPLPSTATFHRFEFEMDRQRDKQLVALAYDSDTLVVSVRPDVTPLHLATKLAGKRTSKSLHDRVSAAVDLRKPLWGYIEPKPGVLPQGMLSAHGEFELWNAIGLIASARFADEQAAASAQKLADSYLTILSSVPEVPDLTDFAVTRNGTVVRLEGSTEIDKAIITSLSTINFDPGEPSEDSDATPPRIQLHIGDDPRPHTPGRPTTAEDSAATPSP